jgi:hypothetical protein
MYCFYAYRLYFLTCDMYKSSLRHIHDPVLSSLKKKGIRLHFLCSPTPSTTRSHTCAYVTRVKDNVSRSFEMCHVIHDTSINSGQWPRCAVTNGTCGSRDFQGHTKKAPTKTYTCQKRNRVQSLIQSRVWNIQGGPRTQNSPST